MDNQKKVPYSLEGEKGVLSAMLLDSEARDKVFETLDVTYFYEPSHCKIFETIKELYTQAVPIDVLTITERLERKKLLSEVGGRVYLMDLRYQVASPYHINYYIRLVLESALRRKLIEISGEIIERCYESSEDANELLDAAEGSIFSIAENRLKTGFTPMHEIVDEAYERILSMRDRKEFLTGYSTGFSKLDEYTSGLQRSDLIIIAGRPSMGKTAFALNLARHTAIKNNLPVAIFSLEMSRSQLAMRMLAAESKIDSHRLRSGKISSAEFSKIALHLNPVSKAPIYIDDSPNIGVLDLRAKTRRLKSKVPLSLVIIDYLQLMVGGKSSENRQQEISQFSRALKGLARELNVPVIALSQLSRMVERREKGGHRPQLADLRESGAIEQDADVVMFVYRPEVYQILKFEDGNSTENVAEIIIGKQRNGPIGNIRLMFHKEYASFEELAMHMTEEPSPEGKDFGGVL